MATNLTVRAAPTPSNTVSEDFQGSFDEWLIVVATEMSQRYARGDESMLGSLHNATGPVGQPNINDKGKDTGDGTYAVSDQTWMFWYNYAKLYKNDPWITGQFGPAPTRQATYVQDPNSPSALQDDSQAHDTAESALDRQNALDIASTYANATITSAQISADASKYGADKQLEGVKVRAETDWKIAVMQDATSRYIAEGNWGVQKYVAELQDAGMDRRLQWELGFRREELAQRAIEEKNRNQLENNKLALEIAKYDSELAASPRNWLKYAGWLQSRDIVVNGLSLAMAAQEVNEADIDPATVGDYTASPMAAIQTAQETQQATASGLTGGSVSSQDAFTGTVPLGSTQQQQQAAPTLGTQQAPLSATDLQNTNPTDLANRLLGSNPIAGQPEDATTQNLQNIMDNLATSGSTQRKGGFGAYGGPTQNALGVNVPDVAGKDVDYRKFSKLLPSQQEAKVGSIESVRGPYGVSDWVAEMERSRPKGKATGAVGFG